MPRPHPRSASVVLASVAVLLVTALPARAATMAVSDPKGDVEVTAADGGPHTSQARSLDILSVSARSKDSGAVVFTVVTRAPLTDIAPGKGRDGQLAVTLCDADASNGCDNGVLVNVPLPSKKLYAAAFTYDDQGVGRYCPKFVDLTRRKNVVTLLVRRKCLTHRTGMVLSAATRLDMGSGDRKARLQDATALSPVGGLRAAQR